MAARPFLFRRFVADLAALGTPGGVEVAAISELLKGTRELLKGTWELRIVSPHREVVEERYERMVDALSDLVKCVDEGGNQLRAISFVDGSVVYGDMEHALATLVKKAGNVRKLHFPGTWHTSRVSVAAIIKSAILLKGPRLYTDYRPDPPIELVVEETVRQKPVVAILENSRIDAITLVGGRLMQLEDVETVCEDLDFGGDKTLKPKVLHLETLYVGGSALQEGFIDCACLRRLGILLCESSIEFQRSTAPNSPKSRSSSCEWASTSAAAISADAGAYTSSTRRPASAMLSSRT